MTFAMIAAGALLATAGQPKDPSLKVGLPSSRFYQWMIVPGGGVFPMPTPFVVLVPLGKVSDMKAPLPAKARQEMHIVIQADQDGVITEQFAQAVIDQLKHVIEEARDAEVGNSGMKMSQMDCKKTDPKQVIDPIVTGF